MTTMTDEEALEIYAADKAFSAWWREKEPKSAPPPAVAHERWLRAVFHLAARGEMLLREQRACKTSGA